MEHDETTADGPAVKIFYETLLQQRPDSAMAAEWLMKRGLLKDDVAKTWLKQLGKDKKGLTASKPALKRKVRPKGRLHPMTTATPGQLVGSLEHSRADLRLHSDCRHLPTISTRVQLERGRVRRRRRQSRRRRRPLLRQTPDEPFEKKPKPAARKPPAQAKKPPAQAKKPPAPAAKKPPHKKAVAAGDSSDEDERPLSQRTK
eukprot:scaffold7353_cov143-Isochrysis_galbana.AAC.2